jgi:peptidoglycan-associated lipoprotein
MKTSSLLSGIFVGAALTLLSTGCKHSPQGVTYLGESQGYPKPTPPGPIGPIGDQTPAGNPLPPQLPVTSSNGIPSDTNGPWAPVIANHDENRVIFKDDTVYFDFDSATIKKSEDKKLEDVAAYFKTHTAEVLQVEGNCDERGTEKYNLALGERRALAVREYLVTLGMDSREITTVTFGAKKPADPGHNEAAWAKNRRGDLILWTPKK